MTPRTLLKSAALGTVLGIAAMTASHADEPASRPFTIFMHVSTTDSFLALSPAERLEWVGETIVPILQNHPEVGMRFYDAEFYSAATTDIVVLETTDLDAYQAVVERLRETEFWGPYFTVNSITPARENAFADFYGDSDAVSN